MRTKVAQKVKQQVKSKAITAEQSLTLVKNLLRTSIASVAYIRNLFDPEHFGEARVGDVAVKTLLPKSNREVKTLLDWLEVGVFHALERKYLDTVLFEIYECTEKEARKANTKAGLIKGTGDKKLLECHSFEVQYPGEKGNEDTRIEFKLASYDGAAATSSRPENNEETIQRAATGILRKLIELTSTLSSLPSHRIITLKILYRDGVTPHDYEPPFFKATDGLVSWFTENPVTRNAGQVATPYHCMNIDVRTLPEYAKEKKSEEICEEPEDDDSQPDHAKKAPTLTGKSVAQELLQMISDDDSDFTGEKCRIKLKHTRLSSKPKKVVSTAPKTRTKEKGTITTTKKTQSCVPRRSRRRATRTTESEVPTLVNTGKRKVSEIEAPIGQARRSKRIRRPSINASQYDTNF